MKGAPVLPLPLVEAAVAGGPKQIEDLIRAVWPRAYRIAYSILGSRTLAEDAAQEACAVLFGSISKLRAAAAFNVWFYRIVVHEASTIRCRNEQRVDAPEWREVGDPEDSIERIDILKALSILSPAQRIAIALHFYADMTSPEIAAVLGTADSSIRFNIMQAKQRLRKALRRDQATSSQKVDDVA